MGTELDGKISLKKGDYIMVRDGYHPITGKRMVSPARVQGYLKNVNEGTVVLVKFVGRKVPTIIKPKEIIGKVSKAWITAEML